MINLDTILYVVNESTLIAVALGGLTLGFYLAAVNDFKEFIPSRILAFTTMLIIGWSFIIPLGSARYLAGSELWPLWIGVMLLWAVFAASSTVGNTVASGWRRNR